MEDMRGRVLFFTEGAAYVLLSLWLVLLGIANIEWLDDMTGEDGVIENLSAFFWLAGLISCVWYLVRGGRGHRPMMLLFMILCFLCLGEELNWGQRIFRLETPGFLRNMNFSKELALHNMPLFSIPEHNSLKSFITTGRFHGEMMLNPYNLLRGFVIVYFLIFPIFVALRRGGRFFSMIGYYPPRLYFVILLLCFVLTTPLIGLPEVRAHSTGETQEMCYALFIAIYTLHVCRSLRTEARSRKVTPPLRGFG